MSNNINNNKQDDFKPFKERICHEDRFKETQRKRELYPNLIPIILESQKGHSSLPQLDRPKYLVSEDLKLFDLQMSIRGKLSLNKSDSLFFYIGGKELDKLDTDLKTIY
jgi:hypothetical protein